MILQYTNFVALAIIFSKQRVYAHGDHDHDRHHHHHNHLREGGERRLGLFGGSSPPGLCKDGDSTFTVGGVTYECEAQFNSNGGQCRTQEQTADERAQMRQDFLQWKAEKAKGQGPNKDGSGRALAGTVDWSNDVITIPTWFHVIHDGNTGKQYTFESNPNYIIDQIKVMNKGFRGQETAFPQYQNGARSYARYDSADIDSRIQFCLAGTTATDNSGWYNDRGETTYKAALDKGGMETLNVFVNTAGGYLGYAYFPTSSDSVYDGVVLANDSMPGGPLAKYSEGDTLTHEVGHWLALEHTHQSGCSGVGDYMSDADQLMQGKYGTKSCESTATFDCPLDLNNCDGDAGVNPIHNFMAYSQDNCMDEFTPGQKDQMRFAWETYRHKPQYSEFFSLNGDGYSCAFSGPTEAPSPTPACRGSESSCTDSAQCCAPLSCGGRRNRKTCR